MAGEERVIELTVISANDLKKVKKFGMEQKCYAEAYIYPSQKHATKEDNYGGVNPNWNEKLTLTCFENHIHPPSSETAPSTSHAITVNIFCKSSGLFHHEPHLVGTVTIPLREIGAKRAPEGIMRSYDVHREGEEIQGDLFLSVKLGPTRPLAQYEDPSAAQLSHYSSEKVGASTAPSQKDSRIKGSVTTTANDKSPMSTSNPRNSDSPPSSSANATGVGKDDETVMGYPATPIYVFDPLNQMPAPGQQQGTRQFDPLGQFCEQNQQQLYNVPGEYPMCPQTVNDSYQMNPHHYNNCRRCGRIHRKAERKAERRMRRKCGHQRCEHREGGHQGCGRRRRGGPIKLVKMLLLGPMVMGLRQLHHRIEHK